VTAPIEEDQMSTDARTGLTVIDRDECLRLLAGDVVGRLAIVHGGAPVILPVNYVVDGEDIVIRTAEGTKLDAGPRAPAAFEIDGIDRTTRTGWSVVASGRLEEVTPYDTATWQRVTASGPQPWAAGPKDHWLRLVTGTITGRRIGP
jgi:nitroimidazol reductase NimA-like FMN-containing flavoprotein (pyridoxamine 5'-phosphate oxidase superfamily)